MVSTLWLGGHWRDDLPLESVAVESPVDPQGLGEWPLADASGAAAIVDAVLAAAPVVPPLEQRCAALRRLADSLEADAPALAAAVTLENGCPARQAQALQVHSAVGLLRAMAAIGENFAFAETRPAARGGSVRVELAPVGLALGIVPWNVPLFLACAKIASSLIAGCPLLLKPSPENAPSMQRFSGHLARLDLPAGMLNVAIGGRELGATLVDDARIAKVSFTGSTAAGRGVAEACARRLARCTLELGGKSAAVLLDDVELPAVREQLFLAMLQNNGQVCGAQSRVLLPRSRFGELRDALKELFEALQAGDPRDESTDVGPLSGPARAARIRELCGAAPGVASVAGSACEETPAMVAPQLFELRDASSPLWREELFAPVVVIAPYDNEDEAVALANDSPYGLAGSVWSPDTARAAALAGRLRTGTVAINSKKILDFAAPFGGWGQSGMGREFGPEGIREYLESRVVLLP
jgi:acyl-CoA reductase-like NAD-dependent aldehyde dehydrogenase